MTGRTLPRLAARFRPERPRLAAIVLFVTVSVTLSVAGPAILGHATNLLFAGIIGKGLPAGLTKAQAIARLRSHGEGHLADLLGTVNFIPGTGVNLARLDQVLGLAAGVCLLAAASTWAQAYIVAGVAQRIIYGLRQAAEEKLARLPLRYFDSHPHGDILSRFTNDLDNLNTTLQTQLSQLLVSLLTVLGAVGLMFWISPLLAGITLATIPLTIAATTPIVRRTKPQFEAQWNRTGQLNGLVEETHTGHAVVLAFGQRQPMIEEFARQNKLLRQASFRAEFLSGTLQPTIQLIGNLNYVFIAALGGFLVATGKLSLGGVLAFVLYARQFSGPVTEIASQMNMLQSGLASAKRVFDFLDTPEEAVTGTNDLEATAAQQPEAPRRVRLEHVSFRYNPAEPLIEDFTLEAAPGQTVAIVGPTGAGKTTIVNLLVRFYEIGGGRILLDGADYRDLSLAEVRRCFGMVLQDTWLFAGTIWDNIAYGKEDASDEEIVAAARAAHVDHFVRALPEGYATVVDGDASSLSSGQKQLLTIARAFLANPGILILDEATSNVDTRTELLIQNAMARLRAGRTSFVIAHRLSTIRDADTIVVMKAGRIVEQGSHTELLSRQGFYHHLYNSQFVRTLAP